MPDSPFDTPAMARGQAIDVGHIVDDQPVFGLYLKVFAILFLTLLADGFDLQAMGYAAPAIVRDLGIARGALASALSAGLVGVLIGAPAIGWFGDRFGRRNAIILGSVLYGSFCIATGWADTATELAILRFLTGIGLGGVLPNVIALAAEFSPGRVRPMMTALVTVGISFGGAIAGVAAATLVPAQGWPILFQIGGAAPLLLAILIWFVLPESPSFLALHPNRRAEMVALLRRIKPGLAVSDTSLIVVGPNDHATTSGQPAASLFEGPYRLITPLVWMLFVGVLMSIYLLSSWLPLALESSGMSPKGAAVMNSMLQFGGAAGGIVVAVILGRWRWRLVVALLGGAWAILGLLSAVALPDVWLAVGLGFCGVSLIGSQTAINTSAGLIYPAAMRAKGVGFALGVGRLGSISGPLIGALVLGGASAGAQDLFLVPLLPLGIAFVAALAIVRLVRQRGL
ncbi:MFS transporter [Sphingobium sp. SA2]|uniref:MFS transporter n=1 Tax=Sphingobium sp. SA2 TaxID=1524832 RepID=UPI0028BF5C6D|nr:MFS transporter [Sphingobium sp. SA2]MDT7533129.1 MFS transporter [Sphingobium sp. SA2]